MALKLTTWNVNGLRRREPEVLRWIAREEPDLLCLQELKCTPEQVPASLRALEGYWSFWHGRKAYSGVAMLLRRATVPRCPQFRHPAFDDESRIVTAEFGDVVVASLYVPNGGKDYPAKVRFFEAFIAWVERLHDAGRRVVVCGDINVAREERDVYPALRKPKQIGQTPEERGLFSRLLEAGLVDVHRRFAPRDERLYTWWAPWAQMRERNIGWRLDYVLVSEPLARLARSCVAERTFGTSDHAPVTAEFELELPEVLDVAEHRAPETRGQLGLGW